MPDLACPKCNNPDVRRFSLLHKQGSTDSVTSTTGIGLSGGGLGIGVASSRGTNVSQLAQETAPPQQKPLGWPVFVALISVYGLMNSISAAGLADSGGVFVVTLVVSGILIHQRRQHNSEVFPGLMARWERSFMCLRCGEQFQAPF